MHNGLLCHAHTAYTEREASSSKKVRDGDTANPPESEQQVDKLKAIKFGKIAYLEYDKILVVDFF